MRGARARRREEQAGLRSEIARVLADVTCGSCGRTFEGQAAYTVHDEHGQCLAGDAHGQLVQLEDGRWGTRWRHPEIT